MHFRSLKLGWTTYFRIILCNINLNSLPGILTAINKSINVLIKNEEILGSGQIVRKMNFLDL